MDKKEKGTVAFSSSRYWDETYTPRGSSIYPWVYDNKSNLYQYVESYKTLLGNTDKVSEVSLASYEDINALWSSKSNIYLVVQYIILAWVLLWIIVEKGGYINFYNRDYDSNNYGVRPVITIDMSKI